MIKFKVKKNPDKSIYKILKRFSNNKKYLLEAGSNTGHFSLKLAKEGFEVTLLDRLEEPILIAKKLFQNEKINAKFVVKDILDYDGSFDLVWNTGVIQCYPDNKRNNIVSKLIDLGKSILFIYPNINDEGFDNNFNLTNPPGIGNCEQFVPHDVIDLVSNAFFEVRVGIISKKELGLPYSMTYIFGQNKLK